MASWPLLLLCVYRYNGCVDVGPLAPRCCCCCRLKMETLRAVKRQGCEQTRTKHAGLKTGGRLRTEIDGCMQLFFYLDHSRMAAACGNAASLQRCNTGCNAAANAQAAEPQPTHQACKGFPEGFPEGFPASDQCQCHPPTRAATETVTAGASSASARSVRSTGTRLTPGPWASLSLFLESRHVDSQPAHTSDLR